MEQRIRGSPANRVSQAGQMRLQPSEGREHPRRRTADPHE